MTDESKGKESKGREQAGNPSAQAGKAIQSSKTEREHWLEVTIDGNSRIVDKDRIVIGTLDSSDIQIRDSGISPLHAVIEFHPKATDGSDLASIYDLASESGVFVDGVKSVTTGLRGHHQIQVGSKLFEASIVKRAVPNQSQEEPAKKSVTPSSGPRKSVRASGLLGGIKGRGLFTKEKPHFVNSTDPPRNIYDYSLSEKTRALEVAMSWQNTILDIKHFIKPKRVTIGAKISTDFAAPASLRDSVLNFVERKGNQLSLNLDEKMTGVIQRNGELIRIEDLVCQKAENKSYATVDFGERDFAKVKIGQVSYFLSHTPAPPIVKTSGSFERDALFLQIMGLAVLLGAGFLTAILNYNVPVTIEAEKIPERMATILYQPERFTTPQVKKAKEEARQRVKEEVERRTKPKVKPKVSEVDFEKSRPKTKPKEAKTIDTGKVSNKASGAVNKTKAQKKEDAGQEGAGARKKGTEGERGSKTAAPGKTPQEAASRPSPKGGEGRGGGKSKQQNLGNLDVLKGATSTIKNLLGNTAANLGKGGSDKIKGYGGFTTKGEGGAGLSGTGAGGGGSADSLGGLADKGAGGGRVGTGLGAAGSGNSIIGGKSRVAIRTGGPEETVVMGAIDASAIEAAILRHRDEFRLCYEREINAANPSLSGRVSTSFVIGATGRVSKAGINNSSLKNRNAEVCIVNVIRRIQFPKPAGGGIVQVRYPFKFRPAGGS